MHSGAGSTNNKLGKFKILHCCSVKKYLLNLGPNLCNLDKNNILPKFQGFDLVFVRIDDPQCRSSDFIPSFLFLDQDN